MLLRKGLEDSLKGRFEVKSGRTKSQGGMAAFLREYPEATRIVVGGSAAGAVTVENFLLNNVTLPWPW